MVVPSPKPTATPWPALLPLGPLAGKPPIPIARPATLVGTRQTANLRLNSSQVSKAHALILSSDSRVYVRDLNSRNKVFVNGKEVREAQLKEGDQLKIGRYQFRFTAGPEIQSSARRRTLPAGQLETDAGDVLALDQRVVVIGQRSGCDLVIPGETVSTTHAAIFDVNGRRYIMDLGSRSGTFVNNQKTLQVELKIGDVIEIGGNDVRYVAAEGAAAAPTGASVRSEAPASAPAPLPPPDADLDELLALDSLSEAPAPATASAEPKTFAPGSAPEDSNAPIPLEEDEVRLPEPTRHAPPAKKAAPPAPIEPELQPQVAEQSNEDLSAEKAAEDELLALLNEASVNEEPIAVDSAQQQAPPAAPEQVASDQVEEEPLPSLQEEMPVPMAEIEPEPAIAEERHEEAPQEFVPEPALPVEVAAETPAEPELPLEPEPELAEEPAEEIEIAPAPGAAIRLEAETSPEIALEPAMAEVQPPDVATTHADLIPEASEEVAAEVKEAANAFEIEDLPNLTQGQEAPIESEEKSVVRESADSAAVQEDDIESFLQEEPTAFTPVEAPPSLAAAEPPAPVDLNPPEETISSPDLIPIVEPPPPPVAEATPPPIEAPRPAAIAPPPQFSTRSIAPTASAEPPPIKIAARPRWVTTSADTLSKFGPTVVTIKPPKSPSDFDLDEFLGNKSAPLPPVEQKHQEPVKEIEPQIMPPVAEVVAAPPPPAEEPPAVVAQEEPAAPVVEERAEAAPEPDVDDLALLALEEAAPVPEESSEPAPPIAIEPQPIEEIEAEISAELPPSAATISTGILPEAPATVSATFALAEDEDLLESPPDEVEAQQVESLEPNIVPVTTAPAARLKTRVAPIEDDSEAAAEPAAPDVFSIGQARARTPAAPPKPAHRGVGSPGRIPPRGGRVSPPIPPRWGPLASAVAAEVVPQASPRRTRKKLSFLVLLMLVAMVVAAVVVWKLVLPRVVVLGTIHYEGAASIRGPQLETLQKNQLDLLSDGKVRAAAEGLFRSKKPTAAGFFVEQDLRHPQLKREWVTNGDRSDLQITYQGSNPTLDADRLHCLLLAIYQANASQVAAAGAASKTVEQKRLAVVSARAELAQIRDRKLALQSLVRPDPAELAAAQTAVEKLDQDWTAALSARKTIAADVDRLRQPTATAANETSGDADSSLKLMSEKLTALNGRVAEAKSAAVKQAADARKSLNTSIDDFQTSLAVAQGMMKDNPALASYITSAQKLHDASWKLQGDLIERQERQQKQLVEYKKRLEEQVEAHKRDMLEKDEGLKELNHLLEMRRREVNAISASGGLKRDVERLRSEMATLEEKIMARTVAVGEDKFYTDAISGLKQIIDSVQGQLNSDRAASEKLMNDLETRFRNTSPEIESLPDAQRSLAARLAGQVNVMQSARKNYTEAVQAQDADANARLKELQAQAVSLESEIALRRKELSAEQQKKLTDQQAEALHKKQGELAEAEKTERAAREAYRQKIKDYDQLVERDRAFQSTREELQRIMQVDEPVKADQVSAAERAQTNAQRAADTAVAPQPPEQPKILEIQDNRALFSTGAVLIVGLVFGALIFLSLHFEPRHRHDAPSGEEKPVSA